MDDDGDPGDCPRCGKDAVYYHCTECGGDGLVELEDHPELWAEDCFCEPNQAVTCPECHGDEGYWWCTHCAPAELVERT
jgi:hypothetical protein